MKDSILSKFPSKKKFRFCPHCRKDVWGRICKGIFVCSEHEHTSMIQKSNKSDDIQNMLFI